MVQEDHNNSRGAAEMHSSDEKSKLVLHSTNLAIGGEWFEESFYQRKTNKSQFFGFPGVGGWQVGDTTKMKRKCVVERNNCVNYPERMVVAASCCGKVFLQ